MVAAWKQELVDGMAADFKKYPVSGVVSISGVPSKQFQQIRATLRDDVKIVITRKRLIERAMKKAKVEGLDDFLEGSVGLVFTELDPFQLERKIYSCKSKTSAKPGQTVEEDIVIEEGDTGLPAGPIIGEIQAAGIKAKIDGGKIVVMKKSVAVKAGEEVTEEIAPVLKRLGVEPIDIMLQIKGVTDGETVYTADVLHIDIDEVFGQFSTAHQQAFNLAYNAGYFTKDTLPLLLQKAFMESLNLALNAEIITKDTLPTFIGKANAQAKALKALVPDEIKGGGDKPEKEESKPEGKADEDAGEKTTEEKPGESAKEDVAKAEEKSEKPAEEKPAEKTAEEDKPAEDPEKE